MAMFPFNDLTDYQFKHLDEPLLLPPELVRIVKAFSKPILRYPREYKDALRETHKREWPVLKEKLSGPYADQALNCLNRFLAARIASDRAYHAYKTPEHELTAEEYEQVRTEYYTTTCERLDIMGELLDLGKA